MSFDVFLQGFRNGGAGPCNRAGVQAALADRCRVLPEGDGFYRLETPDGGHVEFACDLETDKPLIAATFFLRGWTADIMALMYDVAVRGGMVMMPAMPGVGFVLTAPEQFAHVPAVEDWYDPILCSSAAELGELLSGGMAAWQAYRDQVLG